MTPSATPFDPSFDPRNKIAPIAINVHVTMGMKFRSLSVEVEKIEAPHQARRAG
jgi:hypothetical protein